MKRVLMLAYQFPPLAGSSGIQRTLRFVQHLPKFGWEPIVLSANPRAYERSSDDLMSEIPAGTVVHRAFALDTARHLSLGGRYVAAMARPDRWVSWKFAAVRDGMQLIEKYRPHVLWSTYPIATAHLIGAELQRRSGLPWVADFRDPMAQETYPADPVTRRMFRDIEAEAVRQAALSLFTTPGAARIYRERYPEAAERVQVLENGYDEESFAGAETSSPADPLNRGAITLLHSGIVYPHERDPSALFLALQRLKDSGQVKSGGLKIRFRAAVHDDLLNSLAKKHGVEALIETCPALPYREALAEMLRADVLLVMQAANCNDQIPAKVYEYLRAQRPIVGLTDFHGDTANLLRGAGCGQIVDLSDPNQIYEILTKIAFGDRSSLQLPDPKFVAAASREARSYNLALALDTLTNSAR